MKDYYAGKYVPVKNVKKKLEEYKKSAQFTLTKKRNINIRISERDLRKMKEKAFERGIPYQTLAGSILHQFANGKVKELTR